MRSALYYPHMALNSEAIIKTGLLLWDQLEFIVPDAGFRPRYNNKFIAQAMELIGLPHPPNQEEKQETHTRIEELLKRRLPWQLYYKRNRGARRHFEMHPAKLLPETWRLLQD